MKVLNKLNKILGYSYLYCRNILAFFAKYTAYLLTFFVFLLSGFLFSGFTDNTANAAIGSWKVYKSDGGVSEAAKVRLIGSYDKFHKFSKFEGNDEKKAVWIGVHFKIAKGWKIYAPDSSGIGLAPKFDLNGYGNVKSLEVLWPEALSDMEEIAGDKVEYKIYKEEVVIPIKALVNDEDAQEVNVDIDLLYGLCNEICIPVRENLKLNIDHENYDRKAARLIGKFYDSAVGANAVGGNESAGGLAASYSLLYALLLAFVGGAILNVMPCVLPVISIKLLSIIDHGGAECAKARAAFISSGAGIVFSFVALAAFAAALKSLGYLVGWGLQFQNPYFLIFLSILLVIFAANLFGLFEIRFSSVLATLLNKKITQYEKDSVKSSDNSGRNGDSAVNVIAPNFLSGMLAVLLATPCSAPFLGSAISFALSQSFQEIFLIFIFMGIGMSSPYIILILFPKLITRFPKPGKWMVKVKYVMGWFLIFTVMWLLYVLMNNIGIVAAIMVGAILWLLMQQFKFFNDLESNGKILSHRKKVYGIAAVVFLSSIAFFVPAKFGEDMKTVRSFADSVWVEFDENKINKLVAQGKIVVIDITADWCITCKANKAFVLNREDVVNRLSQDDVVAMRGDLTNPNPNIVKYMASKGRYAIPFNIVYGPNAPQGILASELLTKNSLLDMIGKAQQYKAEEQKIRKKLIVK